MDLKATIDKDTFGYRNRLILIALGALFYAALCVYDAKVKYPDQIKANKEIERVKAEHPTDWKDHWPAVAEANGWDPDKEPKERSQGDIMTQWWQFAVVFPIGSYCLFTVLVWSRRYIGADDSKLYATGDVEVPFDEITRIDAARWENKGIARVYYDIGAGEKSILIDDFKFERQTTDEIFNRILKAVDDEKIEGLTQAASEEVDQEEPDQEDVKQAEPQAS
jgi:hypothetical protein